VISNPGKALPLVALLSAAILIVSGLMDLNGIAEIAVNTMVISYDAM
jgi:hypothetical protein